MGERRVRARVLGPGAEGALRVGYVAAPGAAAYRTVEVEASRLPPALRVPHQEFVAVVDRGQFQRVEPEGASWLEIQDRVRAVLNAFWDPIGVAARVPDEYDGYIAEIHSLLAHGASDAALVELLGAIVVDVMGLPRGSTEREEVVARELRKLTLPLLHT